MIATTKKHCESLSWFYKNGL